MTKSLDQYRADAVERTTQRIKRALSKLRSDLPVYRRKPTKKDLARLAGVHVNTLDLRARISGDGDSKSKQSVEGSHRMGWPISELKALQKEWRARSLNKKSQPERNKPGIPKMDEAGEHSSLEAYKRQNIALLYRNEELTHENRSINRINQNLKRELELISGENARLKAAHLARKQGRARLKAVK